MVLSLKGYKNTKKIAEGTYGEVYMGKDILTNELVALKKITYDIKKEGLPATTLREINILKKIKHKNIIELKKIEYSNNYEFYMIFEYMDCDLLDYIRNTGKSNKKIPNDPLYSYAKQMAQSVYEINSRGVIHRDIKASNFLLDKTGVIKLADFGLARIIDIPLKSYTPNVVTLWYRAPEIILGCKYYTHSIDIWSLACVYAEMHLLHPLFRGKNELDQLKKIFKLFGIPGKETYKNFVNVELLNNEFDEVDINLAEYLNTDDLFTNLLQKMFIYDPLRRISAAEVLKYFK